jgi:hypothetical protein
MMPINLTEVGIKYVVKLKLELAPMMLCWENLEKYDIQQYDYEE